jgi:hypothetical protein
MAKDAAVDQAAAARDEAPAARGEAGEAPPGGTAGDKAAAGGTAGEASATRGGAGGEASATRDGAGDEPAARVELVPGVSALVLFALAWLAAMLWSTQGTVGRAAEGSDIALTSAALALPGVISAALIGGAAVGLAGVHLVAARRGPAALDAWPMRLAASAGGGLLTGVAVAIPIALSYDGLPSIAALAAAVGAAATIGGGLAAVRPVRVIAAGVSGALGVFAVTLVLNFFSPNLLHLYGAGDTGESRFTANAWLALTVSLLSGLVAGALAYAYLRRQQAAGAVSRWPAYLVAGALSGLLTLLGELVTRLGGAHLFRVASAVSADDSAILRYLNGARINRAMVILFVGALTALLLFGRTLRPAATDQATDPDTGTDPENDADPDRAADAG